MANQNDDDDGKFEDVDLEGEMGGIQCDSRQELEGEDTDSDQVTFRYIRIWRACFNYAATSRLFSETSLVHERSPLSYLFKGPIGWW